MNQSFDFQMYYKSLYQMIGDITNNEYVFGETMYQPNGDLHIKAIHKEDRFMFNGRRVREFKVLETIRNGEEYEFSVVELYV